MTKDEALKMAIEALETAEIQSEYDGLSNLIFKAIQACKEALEQPAQEPIHNCPNCNSLFTKEIHSIPAPSWQGLSDDERFIIVQNADWDNPNDIAELIEQALKDKNS